jgi:hypothetical protein
VPFWLDIEKRNLLTGVQRVAERKSFLCIGRNKESGKGERWSNVQFDQNVDIPLEEFSE